MKRIQPYSKDALVKLRKWLWERANIDPPKYFEVFVDDDLVVQRTNNIAHLWHFKIWMHEKTQMVSVHIYPDEKSEQADIFCFRTSVNKEDADHDLMDKLVRIEKENEMLKEHIKELEDQINLLKQPLDKDLHTSNSEVNLHLAFAELLATMNEKLKKMP